MSPISVQGSSTNIYGSLFSTENREIILHVTWYNDVPANKALCHCFDLYVVVACQCTRRHGATASVKDMYHLHPCACAVVLVLRINDDQSSPLPPQRGVLVGEVHGTMRAEQKGGSHPSTHDTGKI